MCASDECLPCETAIVLHEIHVDVLSFQRDICLEPNRPLMPVILHCRSHNRGRCAQE